VLGIFAILKVKLLDIVKKMSYLDRSLLGLLGTGLMFGSPLMMAIATNAAEKSHGEVAAIAKASTVKICQPKALG
jgi:hypothetical protein